MLVVVHNYSILKHRGSNIALTDEMEYQDTYNGRELLSHGKNEI